MDAAELSQFREQVESFVGVRGVYVQFAHMLELLLRQAATEIAPLAIVEARAKAVSSFAEKAARKRDEYPDPVNQMTDLCGARIITPTVHDIEPFCEYIRGRFEVDEAASQDVVERLRPHEFGYRSVHFVVSVKPDTFDPVRALLSAEEEALLTDPNPILLRRHYSAESGPRAPTHKAEIQVRTLLQHAWATASHDHAYKGSLQLPWQWERDAARVAAILEDADEALGRFVGGLASYETPYGAYLPPDRIEEELKTLGAVRSCDEPDERLALRIALLHIELKQHDSALAALESFADSSNVDLLRALARATHGAGRPGRRKLLERALTIKPNDPETLCDLAETCLAEFPPGPDGCNWEACRHFLFAYQGAQQNPRALAGFIQTKIRCDGNAEFLPLLEPSLETAIRELQSTARLGVRLPDVYFEIGQFCLLLGQRNRALRALAKAAQLSVSEAPIQATRAFLAGVGHSLAGASPDRAKDFDLADCFLAAAEVAKLIECADRAQQQDAAAAESRRREAEEARERCLQGLATPPLPPAPVGPVVIVAGGCDERFEQQIADFKILMQDAFQGFSGTVYCGGTTAGISGIVAALPGPRAKIAYLPRREPSDGSWVPHEAYEVRHTPGEDISELEPIQNWIDLLAAGVNPTDVKLIGVNGGAIAAFEFRMALALGATVGVLADSGRAATRLADDPEWDGAPGLARLPSDTQVLRAFLGYGAPPEFGPDERERMAQACHQHFLEHRTSWVGELDPALVPWEELRSDLKESNRLAVDYLRSILAAVGLQVRKATDRDPVRMTFTPTEVETMAEAEHGRWVVERQLSGWTLGKRDLAKKTSPNLLAWADLPDNAKEQDRRAVRRIPETLATAGYEVCRPAPEH